MIKLYFGNVPSILSTMINDGIIGKAVMAGVMIVITMIILFINDKKKIFR